MTIQSATENREIDVAEDLKIQDHSLAYVDTARGIAILMVIAVHLSQQFVHMNPIIRSITAFGQLGVQLFFVASAYTLFRSIDQRRYEDRWISNFYIRRIFRIAPLYWVGIFLYGSLNYFQRNILHLTNYNGFDYSLGSIIANATFIHGFIPSAFNSVVPGGWSIGTEVIFYAMFPALFVALSRVNARGGLFGLALCVAAAFVCAVILFSWVGPYSNNGFWYCFIVNQIPVFLIGSLLYYAVSQNSLTFNPLRDSIAFLVVASFSYYCLRLEYLVALPLVCAVAFATLFNLLRGTVTRVGWLERIGQASYSMYVFHFVLAKFGAKFALAKLPRLAQWENIAFPLAFIVIVALTYGAARISERLIEDRFILYGRRLIAWRAK